MKGSFIRKSPDKSITFKPTANNFGVNSADTPAGVAKNTISASFLFPPHQFLVTYEQEHFENADIHLLYTRQLVKRMERCYRKIWMLL